MPDRRSLLRWDPRQRLPSVLGGLALTALAGLCALAHHSLVHSGVDALHLELLDGPHRPVNGTLAVPLPALESLDGRTSIVALDIEGRDGASRRVAISVGGLPVVETVVPSRGGGRTYLRLGAGAGRALAASRSGTFDVRLWADGDEWGLRSLTLATTRVRLGDAGHALIVPASAHDHAAASRALTVSLLALLVLLFVPGRARLCGASSGVWVLAVIGTLVLACGLLLPAVSPYRVLLSQPAYWLLLAVTVVPVARWTGAWLPPACIRGVRATMAGVSRLVRLVAGPVTRLWRQYGHMLERPLATLGLFALAVAHPVFEVVSKSPEFFVARNTTLATAVTTAIVLCGVVPVGLALVVAAITWLREGIGTAAHGVVVACLIAALVLPWLGRAELAPPWTLGAAGAAGISVAAAAWRLAGVRLFLAALGPAAIVVPAIFLSQESIRASLVPADAFVAVPALERTPPIVFIVFDEFPLNSLLDEQGIDEGRFPNFAALARDGYWYPQASTVSTDTTWSVPAIVSGRYPTTPRSVPTLRFYPHNLFTLLDRHYEKFVFGSFLQLCPQASCHYDRGVPPDHVAGLMADLGVVWLHIILPEPLRSPLPPIVGNWRGFAARRMRRGADEPGRGLLSRAAEFDRFISTIDGRPGRLYFLHSLLPHMPFEYVPSGRRYRAPDPQAAREQGELLFLKADAGYADALHQRHLLQVGFVDRLVGRLVARLRELAAYDETLIVITADHGASYREGLLRRRGSNRKRSDVLLVPLFVKLPGQARGGAIDRNVETVDILPTVAEVLGVDLPFEVDGRSLLDGTIPERTAKTFVMRSLVHTSVHRTDAWKTDAEESRLRKLGRFGSGTYATLFSTPPTRDLPGRSVSEFPVDPRGRTRMRMANRQQFESVDLASPVLPLYVRGRIQPVPKRPLTLAVAVNGVIGATTETYMAGGHAVFGTAVPEELLVAGANEVSVYVVRRRGGQTVLTRTD